MQLIGTQLKVREKRYVMVLKKECQFCVRGMEAEGFFFAPINFMNGVHSSWANFFATKGNFKLEREQDFINALKVLQKIPKQLDQIQMLCEKHPGALKTLIICFYFQERISQFREFDLCT